MSTESPYANVRKWVKVLHIISAGVWIGGTASLTALICRYHPDSPESFGAHYSLLRIIDLYIIAPGAFGCFITGAIYSYKYNFGFFRLKWIIAKWLLNISFILFGGIVVLPQLDAAIALGENMAAVAAETAAMEVMHVSINIVQWLIIVLLVFLSVFKPWGKTRFQDKRA